MLDPTASLDWFHRPDPGPPDPAAFADPRPWFGLQLEWLWDGPIDEAEIDRQMAAFAAAGISEVTVEAWDGLVTGTEPGISTGAPYLSERFCDLVAHAVTTAADLGLGVWIYDGNGAGDDTGAVSAAVAADPEARAWWKVEQPDGSFAAWRAGGLDRLTPAATERLLDVEHRVLLERIPAAARTALRGFWKDEPRLGPSIPWSPALAETFAERCGYALDDDVLRSVLRGDEPTDRRHRVDFWSTVAHQFVEASLRPLQRWHHEHGLASLVQPLSDGIHLSEQRDFMGSLALVHGASDVVGCDMWPGSKGDEVLAGEGEGGLIHLQAASAAHLEGVTRVQAEPFGLQGWSLTAADMKVLADRLYARGINLVSPAVTHATYSVSQATFCGDIGPANGPLWSGIDLVQAHHARLGELLTGATHVSEIAVVHPQTSVWAADPATSGELVEGLRATYAAVAGALVATWRPFDIVPEEQLADDRSSVVDGAVVRGDHRFRLVVLPGPAALRPSTLEVLERLVAGGGRVVVVNGWPTWSADGDDAGLADRMARLAEHPAVEEVTLPVRPIGERYESLAEVGALRDAVDRALGAGIEINDPAPLGAAPANEVGHFRRGGHDVFLVTNHPQLAYFRGVQPVGHHVATHIHLPARGRPSLWDPATGEVTTPPWWRTDDDGRLVLPLELDPFASVAIVVDPAGADASSPEPPTRHRPPPVDVAPPATWQVRYTAAALPLVRDVPPPSDDAALGDVAAAHPGFAGTATYTGRFATDVGGRLTVDLGDARDVVEVHVDGALVGRKAWPPHRFTVDVDAGDHELVVAVTGTAANVMPGPDHDPARPWGVLGPLRLTVEVHP